MKYDPTVGFYVISRGIIEKDKYLCHYSGDAISYDGRRKVNREDNSIMTLLDRICVTPRSRGNISKFILGTQKEE